MRGIGSLLRRTAVAPAPVARSGSGVDILLGGAGTHNRTAGATWDALIQAYRLQYGYLPTARMAGMLGIPGAWRASNMYSNLIGSAPFQGYRTLPDGLTMKLSPNPAFLTAPSGSRKTRMLVNSSAAIDLLWHGNAIGVIAARDAYGWPTAYVGVPADAVSVAWVDPNQQIPAGQRIYMIGSLTFAEVDIIHIQGPSEPGDLRGMGLMETQLRGLKLASDQIDQAAELTTNSGIPTGLLTTDDPDATPDELAVWKAAWLESQRSRTIAALGANLKFQPIAWTPEAAQAVEARMFSITEVEQMMELPVGWLGGATQSRTYSNIEQDAVNLLKYSWLAGAFPRFEQTFSLHMPRGQWAKANLDAILRSDTLTRYQAHAIATGDAPWMTPNEVRVVEDELPIAGGDALGGPKPKPAPVKATATVQPAIEGSATE